MSFPEETACLTALIKTFSDPCIVELGGQDGEDCMWMLNAFAKPGRFLSVEPDKDNLDRFIARKLPVELVFGAIADHDGECEFWKSPSRFDEASQTPYYGSGFGSIYRPLEGMSIRPEEFRKLDSPIPCFTFDTLFRENKLDHIDLLRADIHGAEKEMIRHGREALKRTRYLFMEAVDWRMYEGAATVSELMMLLPGWTLLKTFPWNILLRNDTDATLL